MIKSLDINMWMKYVKNITKQNQIWDAGVWNATVLKIYIKLLKWTHNKKYSFNYIPGVINA